MIKLVAFLVLICLNVQIAFTQSKQSTSKSTPSKSFTYYNSETGNDTKINIMVQDLGKMTLSEAKIACAKLGKGWRLPTLTESKMMYSNKRKIQGFKTELYWFETKYPNIYVGGIFNFNTGYSWDVYDYDNSVCWVRAVK